MLSKAFGGIHGIDKQDLLFIEHLLCVRHALGHRCPLPHHYHIRSYCNGSILLMEKLRNKDANHLS